MPRRLPYVSFFFFFFSDFEQPPLPAATAILRAVTSFGLTSMARFRWYHFWVATEPMPESAIKAFPSLVFGLYSTAVGSSTLFSSPAPFSSHTDLPKLPRMKRNEARVK